MTRDSRSSRVEYSKRYEVKWEQRKVDEIVERKDTEIVYSHFMRYLTTGARIVGSIVMEGLSRRVERIRVRDNPSMQSWMRDVIAEITVCWRGSMNENTRRVTDMSRFRRERRAVLVRSVRV